MKDTKSAQTQSVVCKTEEAVLSQNTHSCHALDPYPTSHPGTPLEKTGRCDSGLPRSSPIVTPCFPPLSLLTTETERERERERERKCVL